MSQTVIKLKQAPVGVPTNDDFEIVKADIPEEASLKDGEVIVHVDMVSVDPTMRGWISGKKGYVDPVLPGDIMRSIGVGKITASKSSKLAVGDTVSGLVGWNEYVVIADAQLNKVPDLPSEQLLGVFGFTAYTAYFGLLNIGELKAEDVVVVSAAAGATGSVAVQIAKIYGCKVVGIAGGPDKCKYVVEELGADSCIDYKNTTDLRGELEAACPNGVDVYFDNVGGEILDVLFTLANLKARFVACGAISMYNSHPDEIYGLKNYPAIIVKRIKMEGFIVIDFIPQFPAANQKLAEWVGQGKLHQKTYIFEGLEKAVEALNTLWTGGNLGKTLVRVKAQESA